jgi:peptide/nickel transport system permease protein
MLDVLGSDFIRAARAHGLGRRRIVLSYALRNALLPVVTTLGMVFSGMLGANVLVERVFAWPGMGSYALDALMGLDYAPVQGFMLVMAGLMVGVNLLADLLCAVIDPRGGLLRDA